MSEVWKPIPGFEGYYEAGSAGVIRSVDRTIYGKRIQRFRGRPLKPVLDRNGYPQVILCINHTKYSRKVHQLVALTFLGPCPAGLECCHNDGDSANPALGNLRYGTRSENHFDKHRHGTALIGERNHMARLSPWQVRQIVAQRGLKKQRILATEFGVTQSHVSAIQRGARWQYSI